MNSYSIVHVYRSIEDGELHRFSLVGCTFLSIEAAYQRVMDDRRPYTPKVRTSWNEVRENWIAPAKVYSALPYAERVKWRALYGGTGPLFAYDADVGEQKQRDTEAAVGVQQLALFDAVQRDADKQGKYQGQQAIVTALVEDGGV